MKVRVRPHIRRRKGKITTVVSYQREKPPHEKEIMLVSSQRLTPERMNKILLSSRNIINQIIYSSFRKYGAPEHIRKTRFEDYFQIGLVTVFNFLRTHKYIQGKEEQFYRLMKNFIQSKIRRQLYKDIRVYKRESSFGEEKPEQIEQKEEEEGEFPVSSFLSPTEYVLVKEFKKEVDKLLSKLSSNQREMVKLYFGYYGKEYPIKEIAYLMKDKLFVEKRGTLRPVALQQLEKTVNKELSYALSQIRDRGNKLYRQYQHFLSEVSKKIIPSSAPLVYMPSRSPLRKCKNG